MVLKLTAASKVTQSATSIENTVLTIVTRNFDVFFDLTRNFDVFFDLRLNERSSKQW